MKVPDYDKALYYTLCGQWDELLVLMVRTNDDVLSKRIQVLLNNFHYSTNKADVVKAHDELLQYVDHAISRLPVETIQM